MRSRPAARSGATTSITHAYWREGGPEFHNVNVMAVAHGMEKAAVLAHKAAIDAHLREAGIDFAYTNVFWGGRSEIKPSEIVPGAYREFCAATESTRKRCAPATARKERPLEAEEPVVLSRRSPPHSRLAAARRSRNGATSVGANSWTSPGVLRFSEFSDPKNLNPVLNSASPTLDLSMFIFSWTVRYDANARPVPDALTRIPTIANGDVSKDGLTLKYKLRPNIKWQDGAAVDLQRSQVHVAGRDEHAQ